jgi:hypothetical protein
MRKRKSRVTQEDLDRFGSLIGELKVLGKERKDFRTKFIEARENGEDFPEGGPFVIKFVDKHPKDINWKEEAMILARMLTGSHTSAKVMIKTIEDEAPTNDVTEVSVKPNPDWVSVPISIKKSLLLRKAK